MKSILAIIILAAAPLIGPVGGVQGAQFSSAGFCELVEPEGRLQACIEAAESGDTDAQYALGFSYENGLGVGSDLAAALKWYGAAARSGDPSAQVRLARMYIYGQGVQVDRAAGIEWCRRAASEQFPDAMFFLGVIYEEGLGVPQDYIEAERLYRQVTELATGRLVEDALLRLVSVEQKRLF